MIKPKLYIASPYGFSEAGRFFYAKRVLPMIRDVGFEIIDPWQLTDQKLIEEVTKIPYGSKRHAAWEKLNEVIGRNNIVGIRSSDAVVAFLDGLDIDPGTASEIGFAYGIGKPIEGYRGDFRLAGDNEGSLVNLQVEYFIHESGGQICKTMIELEGALQNLFEELKK